MTDERIDAGDGVVLRPFRIGDERSLVAHANDAEVARFLRDRFPHPYTDEDARAWVEFNRELRPTSNFAIAVGGEVIGGAGFVFGDDVHRFSAEVGYWLGRAHWGRGIATRSLRALTAYGFERHGMVRLFAGVFEGNEASARVLEKCGYTKEGVARRAAFKGGRFLDVWQFACVREDALRR
ncbi:MAG: GNAT family N-acetyltransferase [Myxococcales bacterium]|nr:GNAT family N-acetyltransferase [Myxococcales bacterium]